jgi:hypothetical protein
MDCRRIKGTANAESDPHWHTAADAGEQYNVPCYRSLIYKKLSVME